MVNLLRFFLLTFIIVNGFNKYESQDIHKYTSLFTLNIQDTVPNLNKGKTRTDTAVRSSECDTVNSKIQRAIKKGNLKLKKPPVF
jgi:hypothetical protein